eukprot:tig00001234_g7725.t1
MKSTVLSLVTLFVLACVSTSVHGQVNIGGIDAAVALVSPDGSPPAEGLAVFSLMRSLDDVAFSMRGRVYLQVLAWHSLYGVASAEFVDAEGAKYAPASDDECPLGTLNARNFYAACFAVNASASFIDARSGVRSRRGGLTLTAASRGPALKRPSVSATFESAINLTGTPVAFANLFGDNATACGGPAIGPPPRPPPLPPRAPLVMTPGRGSAGVLPRGGEQRDGGAGGGKQAFRVLLGGGALLSRYIAAATLNGGEAGEAQLAASAFSATPLKPGRCSGGGEQAYWVPGFTNPCAPAASADAVKPLPLLAGVPSVEVQNGYGKGAAYWGPDGSRPLLALHTTEFGAPGFKNGALYGRFSPVYPPKSPLQTCATAAGKKTCSFLFPDANSVPTPRTSCRAETNPASLLFSLYTLNCAALSPAQLAAGAAVVAAAAGAAPARSRLRARTPLRRAPPPLLPRRRGGAEEAVAAAKSAELPAAKAKTGSGPGARFYATFAPGAGALGQAVRPRPPTPPPPAAGRDAGRGRRRGRSWRRRRGRRGRWRERWRGDERDGDAGRLTVAGLAGGLTQDALVDPARQGNADYYIGRESGAALAAPSWALALALASLLALLSR